MNTALSTQSTTMLATPQAMASLGIMASMEAYQMAERAAESFSQSTMIPETYQGKPGNCMIALDTAYRLGISALMVMQNLYPVKGKPQWSGQFAIALINNSGKYSSTRYEWRTDAKGEKTGCRMIGIEAKSGKEKEGAWITKEMVSAEGWGAKWRSMPEQMFMYRAAAFFSRAHCPEVTLGMYIDGEAEDIAAQEEGMKNITNSSMTLDTPPAVEKKEEKKEQERDFTKEYKRLLSYARKAGITLSELLTAAKTSKNSNMPAEAEELTPDATYYILDKWKEVSDWIIQRRERIAAQEAVQQEAAAQTNEEPAIEEGVFGYDY